MALGTLALGLVAPVLTIAGPASAAIGDVLLDPGSTWQYWDAGTDPATGYADNLAWTASDAAFDDAAWESGSGSFGVEPSTTITTPWQRAYDSGDNIPTYFLRTDVTLDASDLEGATAFDATFAYDDGAILYVNGEEAYRTTTVSDLDTATNLQYSHDQSNDMTQETASLDPALFTEGENTIAVSVHNRSASSSDVYFEWRSLVATDVVPPPPPVVSNVSLHVGADETQVNLAWFSVSGVTESVQIAPATDGDFPAESATTFATTESGPGFNGQTYHHAVVTGLDEDTDYVYRVGSDEGRWSDTFEFSTEDFGTKDYNVLWVGDPQIGSGGNGSVEGDGAAWEVTMSTMTNLFPGSDFLLSTGDQVNASGSVAEYDEFMYPEEIRQLPIAVNVGNHDTGSVAYDQQFNQPNSTTDGSATGRDYWYTYNDVLYVGLDSNRSSDSDIEAHAQFLEDAVTTAGDVDWTILTFHHAPYSQANHLDDGNVINIREKLTDDISRVGVNLVLSGHDHIHTRSYLMEGGTPVVPDVAPAPGDVLTPAEGQVLYMTANSATASKFYDYYSPGGTGDQPYTAFWEQDYSPDFSNIEISENALTLTTYDVYGLDIVDQVTLQRPDADEPVLTLPAATEIEVGQAFDPMSGVMAVDAIDGDLTAQVSVVGAVDTSVAGEYVLEYTVSDSAGNTATATRVVTVTAPVPGDGDGDGDDDGLPGDGDDDGLPGDGDDDGLPGDGDDDGLPGDGDDDGRPGDGDDDGRPGNDDDGDGQLGDGDDAGRSDGDRLPVTGVEVGAIVPMTVLALLVLGAALLTVRLRRSTQRD
ncbi:immunoglobulin-like domain-containing protein [Georgenia wangjunii]|uniref:immunoglobulin-like domain-containing protein n=1 Tax=Georgenia wangjunii TaxID=3117730 RepID=UPI002F263ADD